MKNNLLHYSVTALLITAMTVLLVLFLGFTLLFWGSIIAFGIAGLTADKIKPAENMAQPTNPQIV